MENASKALIIAGAILLSILLISLGILVYNNARGTIDDANLNSEEVQAFNIKISQYCGNKKSANDMNSLVDAISANNGSQNSVSAAERHYVGITIDSTVAATYYTGGSVTVSNPGQDSAALSSKNYPRFSGGITYKASYTTDDNGYIDTVTIYKQ